MLPIVLAFALPCVLAALPEKSIHEMKRLEGNWELTSKQIEGRDVIGDQITGLQLFGFANNEVYWFDMNILMMKIMMNDVTLRCVYFLEPSSNTIRIRQSLERPDAAFELIGTYQFKDGELTISYSANNCTGMGKEFNTTLHFKRNVNKTYDKDKSGM
jgi:hypothetical protein